MTVEHNGSSFWDVFQLERSSSLGIFFTGFQVEHRLYNTCFYIGLNSLSTSGAYGDYVRVFLADLATFDFTRNHFLCWIYCDPAVEAGCARYFRFFAFWSGKRAKIVRALRPLLKSCSKVSFLCERRSLYISLFCLHRQAPELHLKLLARMISGCRHLAYSDSDERAILSRRTGNCGPV